MIETKQPMRVVNIEDDRDLQRLMAMAFKESEPSLELQQFVSGDAALPYIAENLTSIDLYLIDIMLPGKLNGIEIAQRIREMGAPGHIALTSAFAEPSSDLLQFLVAEFFPKPLHILDIIPRLASYRLNRHSSANGNLPAGMTISDFFPQSIPDPSFPTPTPADWDAAMTERPAAPNRQRRRAEPETGSLPIVPPAIAKPRKTDRLADPTTEEFAAVVPIAPAPAPAPTQTPIPVPTRPTRTQSAPPAAVRPIMEFESLEALDTPIPSAIHESAATESEERVITPLPPERSPKPVPNRGNIVQRLINKLRGI
ncbi:MAG: response regulator [Anaerolineae bacterium]